MSQAAKAGDEPKPAAPASSAARRGWLASCAALALFAYRDLFRFQPGEDLPAELEQFFFIPSDSLGPMVLILSAWLLLRRWGRLRSLPDRPGSLTLGGGLSLAGLAAYLWATASGALDLLIPALMLHASAALWLWKGAPALRSSSLPLAFLLFALPIPAPALNELLFRLQIATTEIAGFFLYLLEIPHYVAGEQILRTEHTFSVIESCSGLRSVQTLSMVSVLMADLFRRRPLHAWLVVGAAPGLAFFLNGIRALTLILNPHSEVVAIHNLQGIAILLSGLVLLFLWDGLLERLLPAGPPAELAPLPPASRAADLRPGCVALASALAVAAAASIGPPRFDVPAPTRLGASSYLAVRLGLSEELQTDRRFLGSVGYSEGFLRRFELGEDDVILFLAIGDRGNRDHSPISPKTGIPASGWVTESESRVPLGDGVEARARVMRSGSRRRLVYHWYQGAGGWRSEALRSLLGLDRSPWRRPGEIFVLRLEAPIHGPIASGTQAAEQKILRFYEQLRPLIRDLEEELSGKRFSGFSRLGEKFTSSRQPQGSQES